MIRKWEKKWLPFYWYVHQSVSFVPFDVWVGFLRDEHSTGCRCTDTGSMQMPLIAYNSKKPMGKHWPLEEHFKTLIFSSKFLWHKIQYSIYLWKWISTFKNIANENDCTEYNQKDGIANWENGHRIASVQWR